MLKAITAAGLLVAAQAGPEQIHLAFGDAPDEMTVTWSTAEPAPAVVSVTGLGSFAGSTSEFGAPYNPDGVPYVHKVRLSGLQPATTYEYLVSGAEEGISFTTARAGHDWAPSVLFFGDMGKYGGAPSLALLTAEAATGAYDAIIHIGDFAYDLDDQGGVTGDDFLNRIQPMASTNAYMTCPGNHEIEDGNFTHYRERFFMPRSEEEDGFAMWYSFDLGNTHFVSYSSEHIFARPAEEQAEQMAWLEADLAAVDRETTPWVVAFAHRPMYCSNIDNDDCSDPATSKVRLAFEPLFTRHGVDVVLEAHEHSVEITYPVADLAVPRQDWEQPQAPTHFISGSAGCNEDDGICTNPMLGPKGEWSAFRSWLPGLEYGYSRLFVQNATSMAFEQVRDIDSKVTFAFEVHQDAHGPF